MKRWLSFICALCLLLCVGICAQAETPDWAEAYGAILDAKQAESADPQEQWGTPGCEYTLYDIDKDGSPELIVKLGTCEADYHGEIYTFKDGGASLICGELGLGHSSLYSDPGENGLILMWGHMGYAAAERLSMEEGGLESVTLYEDDLNERLQTDPDAEYVYPGEVVPGAAYLDLWRGELRLPLCRYEEIERCRNGVFTQTGAAVGCPQGDTAFFERLMAENGEVCAVTLDGFTHSPGRIGFRDLLKQNVAADWMDGDLTVLSAQSADLNGDGQAECVVDLARAESSERMRFFLSEQEGTVYAYLQNYAPEELTADRNGNLRCRSAYYTQFYHMLFDGTEALLLSIPGEYFAE